MSNEQQLAGITPYTIRLAAYYACLGVGTYLPKGYAAFDKIVVSVKMPWQPGASFTESCLVLEVVFFNHDVQLRYVEFSLRPDGFAGTPVVRLVKERCDTDV